MVHQIELPELKRLIDEGVQLVDVMPALEYGEAHLPGATNLPLKELDAESAGDLDPSRPVVVYCYDYLWDLSPRAACRLETLGFTAVYDYVPGKVDWMAHGLPVEGEQAAVLTAGRVARRDVVTGHLDQPVGPLRERVEASPFGFALVTSPTGILLGRLRRAALEGDPTAVAETVMEPGPSTVRPDTAASDLLERLRKRDLRTAIVSTPEGRLFGVVRRSDLEAALE